MEKIDQSDVIVSQEQPPSSARSATKLARSAWARWIFIGLAWLCIALAILGVFIPGLPTVDFIILAVFFAARGSEKLHQWFQNQRYIGPIIQEWQQNRRIPQKAKYISTVSMSLAAGLMIWTIPHPWFVYPAILCMAGVLGWMWLKK